MQPGSPAIVARSEQTQDNEAARVPPLKLEKLALQSKEDLQR